MKKIKKSKKNSLMEDMTIAIKRFSRNEFGFQPAVIHKNKKKYDRNKSKNEMKREYENIPFNFNIFFILGYNFCI